MSVAFGALGPEGYGAYEVEWQKGLPEFTRVRRKPEAFLIPGFVDPHIHGAYGADFLESDTNEIRRALDRLREVGYEAILPTTVATEASAVLRMLERLPTDPMIRGFHLEGPFLSPAYPGAQPRQALRTPRDAGPEWEAIWRHPRLRVVTLAPELPGARELVERLARRTVWVQLGHTGATYAQCEAAVAAGASSITHFFNAMRPLHHREIGIVGFGLTRPSVPCELIYDRVHVSLGAARLLLARKRPHAVIAVSDGTKAIGLPPNSRFEMWGMTCVTGDKDVRLADADALAGSAITLYDAYRNMHEDFGPAWAVRACCINGRVAMGLAARPQVYIELDRHLQITTIRSAPT